MSSSRAESSLPSSFIMGGIACCGWWFLHGPRQAKTTPWVLSISFNLYGLNGGQILSSLSICPIPFSATTAPVPVSCRNQRWRPATSNAGGIKSILTHLTLNIPSPKLVSFHTFSQLPFMAPVYFAEEFFPCSLCGVMALFHSSYSLYPRQTQSLLSPFFSFSFFFLPKHLSKAAC